MERENGLLDRIEEVVRKNGLEPLMLKMGVKIYCKESGKDIVSIETLEILFLKRGEDWEFFFQ